MSDNKALLREVGLTESEYQVIVDRLGREPNRVELGMFGALWSEHCGYKNSRPLLRLLPDSGDRVLVRAGQENAGAIDIGDGLAIVMKIESHNHPSAIEPVQGAATGVGGIVRDIFAMGAWPIAILDSLRFGPLTDARNRYLFGGVVAGISTYGNCLGVPTVGGEIYFAESYSGNPLVNAMCVGVVEAKALMRGRATGSGNTLLLVGAATGRDGILGASFASEELSEASESRRPAVQVGNPFLEKLLMEACREALASGHVVGLQDLGAAGITSAVAESAHRGEGGAEIDVAQVSRRESGMTPYEVMLSESQERMLVVVRRGEEEPVRAIFDRWDLHSDIIGRVTSDGLLRVKDGQAVVAEVPVRLLVNAPTYERTGIKPAWLARLQAFDERDVPSLAVPATGVKAIAPAAPVEGVTAGDALLRLLASPNIASKRWVYRQYDHQVQTNTVIGPGGDAAVLRLRGTRRGIALTTDGNGRYCYLNPYVGGMIAVAEAARNLVCVGAEPVAVTDCLNFGNPEKPEVYYQLHEAIRGIADACRALETPVISGNVSLYNETSGSAIYPTPVIGMLGILEDVERHLTSRFQEDGDIVVLVGALPREGLAASEYLATIHGRVMGEPSIDLTFEKKVQRLVLEATQENLLRSAHDLSDGGLAVALAECCIAGQIGFRTWGYEPPGRLDVALFGEIQSRIIVSLAPGRLPKLIDLAKRFDVPIVRLGSVGGDHLRLGSTIDLPVAALAEAYEGAIEALLTEGAGIRDQKPGIRV